MEICLFTLGLWSAETWKSFKNALCFCCPQEVLLRGIVSKIFLQCRYKRLQEVISIILIIFGLGEVQYLAVGE